MRRSTVYRHWLPILTFCPVNGFPDFIYISIEMEGLVDLYDVRKEVRKAVSMKKMFMEDIANEISNIFPEANKITVALMFNRHVVTLNKEGA